MDGLLVCMCACMRSCVCVCQYDYVAVYVERVCIQNLMYAKFVMAHPIIPCSVGLQYTIKKLLESDAIFNVIWYIRGNCVVPKCVCSCSVVIELTQAAVLRSACKLTSLSHIFTPCILQ